MRGALVGSAYSRQTRQLPRSRARVQALGFALLAYLERSVDEYLDEVQVIGSMQRGGRLAIGRVRADEADERDRPRLSQQAGEVRGAPHILPTCLLVEAQIAVEPVAQVVAVEQEDRLAGCDQALLHRGSDRRLARSRQPGEPHGLVGLPQCAPAPRARHPGA